MERGVSIVVPVFRSAEIVPDLVARIDQALRGDGLDVELILVNDASPDESWDAIKREARGRDWVRGINLMRNFGQHNALLCGIRAATKSVVVTMDDDLQHPPEEVPKLLGVISEGHDVVYGSPREERHGLWRDVSSVVTKEAMRLAMGVRLGRNVSAFRAFRTQLREAFADYEAPYVSIDVLLSWGTTDFQTVEVAHAPRASGSSNYTVRKLVRHALTMVTGFSVVPLRVATVTGFAFGCFGMLVLAYVVGRYIIQGSSVPGFPFLASIIAIFSGVQLFALGVIGEYLGRVHFRVMGRPAYAIRGATQATAEL